MPIDTDGLQFYLDRYRNLIETGPITHIDQKILDLLDRVQATVDEITGPPITPTE